MFVLESAGPREAIQIASLMYHWWSDERYTYLAHDRVNNTSLLCLQFLKNEL